MVIDNAGATSAVSLMPLVQYNSAGARDLEFERLWLPLKEISIKKYIGKLYYRYNNHTKNIGVI
jgi:hypothetical protein